MESPWGKVERIAKIANGIGRIEATTHGGIMLDDRHAAIMKTSPYEPTTGDYHFWEQDRDWVFVYKMFEREIRQQNPALWAKVEPHIDPAYKWNIDNSHGFKPFASQTKSVTHNSLFNLEKVQRKLLEEHGFVHVDGLTTEFKTVTGVVGYNADKKPGIAILYLDGKADNSEYMIDRATLQTIADSFYKKEEYPITLITDMGVELSNKDISTPGIGFNGVFNKPIRVFADDILRQYNKDTVAKGKGASIQL